MTADRDPPPPVLDLERGPWWRGGRFQLRRRPRDPLSGQPWWVRLGAALPWRLEATLAAAACLCAAVGGLLAWLLWSRGG